MEITLIKQLNGTFKPAFDSDYENAKKIALNEPFVFKYSKPRNYKFHKKFFALINMLFQNQDQYNSIEHLRKDLIIAAGYYDTRFNFEGVEILEAKSMSFSSMDEIEFSELYNRIIDVIVKYFNWDREDIIENVTQYF